MYRKIITVKKTVCKILDVNLLANDLEITLSLYCAECPNVHETDMDLGEFYRNEDKHLDKFTSKLFRAGWRNTTWGTVVCPKCAKVIAENEGTIVLKGKKESKQNEKILQK